MSLTTPSIHVPDTQVTVPSWLRRHLSWMLVGLAVLATAAVLAVTVVDSDSDSGTGVDPITTTFDADRGSISAIDHRTAVAGGAAATSDAPAASPAGSLRHESISAIDHRTPPR